MHVLPFMLSRGRLSTDDKKTVARRRRKGTVYKVFVYGRWTSLIVYQLLVKIYIIHIFLK